jgi:arylsulfatase
MARSFIYITAVIFLGVFSTCKEKIEDVSPPNIIIIFTDDQGYNDLGCFGSPDILTPNLDQMARDGAKLTSFYSAQAVCSASRAGLLTGCYPNRIGIHQAMMPNNKTGINETETTLAEILNQNGYATAIFGKWHLGDHQRFLPLQHGFDEYFGIPYSNDMWPYHPQQGPVFNFPDLPLYEGNSIIDTLHDQSNLTVDLTERSVDFIKRNKDQPFFLYVPHPQPHVPLFVSDRFKGKSERGLYGDVIMEIDWSVGQILQTLKEEGLEENTLVIFTSDNGPWLAYGNHAGSAYPLREGKGTAWEGGQKEPFIIKYPGKIRAGSVIETPIMAIDLLPTIAELTGSKLPDLEIDGKNVWPIITGETNEMAHSAYYFYYNVNELFGLRSGDWKLYFPHRYRSMAGQEPGKDGLPGNYTHFTLTEPELYNLQQDGGEKNNVIEQYPEIADSLIRLVENMRKKLGDKLTGIEGSRNREPGLVVD